MASGRGATAGKGGAAAPPAPAAPTVSALRWLIGLRLIVISTLFLGALIIQASTRTILPLAGLYALFLFSYCMSLAYIGLQLKGVSPHLQAVVQLLGDIGIVTSLVYVTGGLYSPFSFLYLTVIAVAAVLLRGGGLVFAGLSAICYGVLVDLMVFGVIPVPPNMVGARMPTSRVLYQLMIHVVGFVLLAILVTYLSRSLRTAHDRLREERERTSQFAALTDHVVRSMGAGILAVGLDGSVLHLNPAGARILGIEKPDEVAGTPLASTMPLVELNWGLLLTRARKRSLVRLDGSLAKGGTRVGLSVGPLEDDHGSVVGFVVNFQDLSEVEIEQERRRLQERMAAVGELAARMAHEVKNPLASISGSAQVLSTVSGVDTTARRLLRIVVEESQRLSAILDGFLDYTRPRQSTHQPCDISAMLRDCMDLLRRSPELRERHLLSLDAPERMVVLGDERLLRQIFWNLSRNALQAMPDGGKLHIRVHAVGSSAVLQWSDNGHGMPNEVRQRAFEPFVTGQPEGTGLGLAIVYSAVQEHRGTIDIASEPGRGTTVTVELPLEEVDASGRREVDA